MSDPEAQRTRGTSGLGARLGARLAGLADRHRRPDDPSPCSTCGLRKGTLANANNRTMLDAMNVLLGLDGDGFGCHHGMQDGRPTRPCAQWVIARRASFEEMREAVTGLFDDAPEGDPFGDYVAEWANTHDPDRRMDNYQLGRLWERTGPHPTETELAVPSIIRTHLRPEDWMDEAA